LFAFSPPLASTTSSSEAWRGTGLNFTLTTTLGDLDLLGEVTGGGGFEALKNDTIAIAIDNWTCLVVSLPRLIALKRAAGRGKDREALAELEALLEERDR
jgi:hypothetical protein